MQEITKYSTEQLVGMWEDRREIKNLMGKYVASLLLKREKTMYEYFWSKREDICMGVNEGYYNGAEAIKDYYEKIDKYTDAVRDLIIKIFPKETAGKTLDELHGVGTFEDKSINNQVIEIASDGLTAKGMWGVYGNVTDVTARGPVSNWVCATYAVDFIRENDEWKIWHLLYLEDVNSPTGYNWSEGKNPYPELPEFASLASVPLPQPNVEKEIRKRYSVKRPFTRLPKIPESYDTFSNTFSYGL